MRIKQICSSVEVFLLEADDVITYKEQLAAALSYNTYITCLFIMSALATYYQLAAIFNDVSGQQLGPRVISHVASVFKFKWCDLIMFRTLRLQTEMQRDFLETSFFSLFNVQTIICIGHREACLTIIIRCCR